MVSYIPDGNGAPQVATEDAPNRETDHIANPATPHGIPLDVWRRLARDAGDHWEIDERDADGVVIGTSLRYAGKDKRNKPGGSRGLILEHPLPNYAGSTEGDPVYVAEGASDTAALMALGLPAVGVPMTGFGGVMLASLLANRHVAIVADADRAGRVGAYKIAAALLQSCDSVKIIDPPKIDASKGEKDARDALIAGATRDDFVTLARDTERLTVSMLPSTAVAERTESRLYSLVPLDQIGDATETDWLWPGFIARDGITLLTGLWKSGKTTLLTHLLRDLYHGGGLVGDAISAPIFYLSEEPERLWAGRRERHHLSSSIRMIRKEGFSRFTTAQWIEAIEKLADDVRTYGAALVVIDTLPSAWPVANENDASETATALVPLRAITTAGAGVLLVHHPRKGDGSEGTATRGSGALPGFVDVIVELRRVAPEDDQDRRRKLKAYGRFDGIPAETIIEMGEDGYRMLGDAGIVSRADRLTTIAGIIHREPGLTVDEIKSRWPSERCPGKTALGNLLESERGTHWTREGTGRRSSPFRYFPITATDSILPPKSLDERNETDASDDLLAVAPAVV